MEDNATTPHEVSGRDIQLSQPCVTMKTWPPKALFARLRSA